MLERIIQTANKELERRRKEGVPEKDPHKFVTYHEGFIEDVEPLKWEAESLQGKNNWLTSTGCCYGWGNVDLAPTDIDKFPQIKKLLEKINKELGSELNSCLVTRYGPGEGVGYHADNEEALEESSPIVVVSLGAPGTVDFIPYLGDGRRKPVLSMTVNQGDGYTMVAGCQEHFKHRVQKVDGVRYALSFRRRHSASPRASSPIPPRQPLAEPQSPAPALLRAAPMPVVNGYQPLGRRTLLPTPTLPSPPPQPPTPSVTIPGTKRRAPLLPSPTPPSTLVLGTSMTKWLSEDPALVNVSVSGARLCRPNENWKGSLAGEMLKGLEDTGLAVKKVILAFGTNDIRHWGGFVGSRKGKGDVYKALVDLVREVRRIFGEEVEIVLPTVIPIRPDHGWTASNVFMLNRIIGNVGLTLNCRVVDWTREFLDARFEFDERLFSKDGVHLNRYGYDVLNNIVHEEIFSNRSR